MQKLITVYKLWYGYIPHFPQKFRYTLGNKIELLLIQTIEHIFCAGYLPKDRKLPELLQSSTALDALNFFLQLAWELKILDNKKFIAVSEPLSEAGRMLGGWQRQIINENQPSLKRDGWK